MTDREYRATHLEQVRAMDIQYYRRNKAHYKLYRKQRKDKLNVELNERLDALFGKICQVCHEDKKLILHHKYYASDSILPIVEQNNAWKVIKRKMEAVEHPERFMRVCMVCHRMLHRHLKKSCSVEDCSGINKLTRKEFAAGGGV